MTVSLPDMWENPGFKHELDKIAQEQAELFSYFGVSKESYFEMLGFPNTENDEERLEIVKKLIVRDQQDDNHFIYTLFSPQHDFTSIPWMRYLAKRFFNEDSPIYRPKAGFRFMLQAAILGSEDLYKPIGQFYHFGPNDTVGIDYAEAIYWYEKSFKYKADVEVCANIMDVYRSRDKFMPSQTLSYPRKISQMIVQAAEIDAENSENGVLKYTAANILSNGYGIEKNEKLAIQYYEELLQKKSAINFYPLRILAVRYALGLGVDANLKKAKKLLVDYPDLRCNCHNYYVPIEELLNEAHKPEYQDVIQSLRDVYHREEGAQLILEILRNQKKAITRADYLIFYAMKVLAKSENWKNAENWVDLLYYVRLSNHGFNPEKVIKDTWRLGPFYNAVASNGLPVLGELHHEHFGTPQIPDGMPIESGIIAFHGLTATPDGQIKFKFSTDEISPAYLLPEDIDTALVLAFGYESFQWPSIDISQHSSNHGALEEAQLKGVEPAWLIETPIGPTLYITDFLSGRLAWDFEEFDVSDSDLGEKGKRLVKQLKSIDAPEAFLTPIWAINVNSKDVILSIDAYNSPREPGKSWLFSKDYLSKLYQVFKPQEKTYEVTVAKVIMRISGGYKKKESPEDDGKWLFKDDMRFRHNQICAKLTEEFDTVAEIIPVYERLRQFTGLIYALHAVRERGFEPNAGLKKYVTLKRLEFEQRIVDKQPEYARSLPFFSKKLEIGC